MNRPLTTNLLAAFMALLLFMLNIAWGSVNIPLNDIVDIVCGRGSVQESWRYIVLQSRLPQALTAMLCGGSLAVSGLLLQTAFRNPLAGPSIFGINSGAGLGVALVMLLFGGGFTAGTVSLSGSVAVLAAAFAGAVVVMGVLLLLSNVVKSNVMLLIVGIMTGYLASSVISLLNFFATDEGVRSYMIWGFGTFGSVTMEQMPLFSAVTMLGLVLSLLLIKPLNALLLGEQYAANLGINVIRLRNRLLVVTGLLSAVTTAYCGPVAFIGLAVPHIARLLLATDNHRYLIPATIICGVDIALLCNALCTLPGEHGIIPLNAVTPVMGAPVIIYVIMKGSRKGL